MKPGMAAAPCARGVGVLPSGKAQELAFGAEVFSRFECQTAFALKLFCFASMNGLGLRPLPAAISSMVRPEATDRSLLRTASPALSRS